MNMDTVRLDRSTKDTQASSSEDEAGTSLSGSLEMILEVDDRNDQEEAESEETLLLLRHMASVSFDLLRRAISLLRH